MSKAVETEEDAASLVGSLITEIGYRDGCMYTECGHLQMQIGSDAPLWFVVKEYPIQ